MHGQINESARMGELAQHNEEDDEAGYPGPELVCMHHLVAKERNEEGRCRDDDNSCVSWNISIHRMNELCADYRIDGGPPHACKDIEKSGDLDAVEAEEVTGKNHLAKPIDGAEGRKERYWCNGKHVDEEDREECIDKAQVEYRNSQRSDGKTRDDHISSEPHSPHFHHVRVRSLIFRHPLNASLLDAKAPHKSLQLGIRRAANFEALAWDTAGLVGIERRDLFVSRVIGG